MRYENSLVERLTQSLNSGDQHAFGLGNDWIEGLLTECLQVIKSREFIVSVGEMKESHQSSYLVCIARGDRPKDATTDCPGFITPSQHMIKEHAEMEAEDWAEFLGVEVTTVGEE